LKEYRGGSEILEVLEVLMRDRMKNPKEGSYTSKVIKAGIKEAAKKVSEEAAEVSVAALAENKERTVYEAADLMYHLLLLLQMKGTNMDEVFEELWRRRG
jgi:phosphoribosyl-ATP pyrophosphohydrolase